MATITKPFAHAFHSMANMRQSLARLKRWVASHLRQVFDRDLGIIVGTSRTLMVNRDGVVQQSASYLAVDEVARKVVASGVKACHMAGNAPPGVSVLRPFLNGTVDHVEAARWLLRTMLRDVRRPMLRGRRVLATAPCDSTQLERNTIRETVREAGAGRVLLLDRAVVAALGADLVTVHPEASVPLQARLLLHVGASDAMIVLAAQGRVLFSRAIRWPADAWTEAIIAHIRDTHHVRIGQRMAETLKHSLGCALALDPPITFDARGLHMDSGLPVCIRVSSTDVCSALHPLLEGLRQQLRLSLDVVSEELLEDIVETGVTLSGGGARLRRLDEFICQRTGLRATIAANPQDVLATGMQKLLSVSRLPASVFIRETPRGRILPPTVEWRMSLVSAAMLASAIALLMWRPSFIGTMFASSDMPFKPSALHMILTAREQEARALQRENSHLDALLKLRPSPRWKPLAAHVVRRVPSGWMADMVLDVGTRNGVKNQMPVINANGLVGQVASTETTRCHVRMISAPRSVVACRTASGDTAGLLYGNGTTQCTMRYLDPDVRLKDGEEVVTSGQDGVFPPGVRVGHIVHFLPAAVDPYAIAVIQPAAHVDDTDEVLVLKRSSTYDTSSPKARNTSQEVLATPLRSGVGLEDLEGRGFLRF